MQARSGASFGPAVPDTVREPSGRAGIKSTQDAILGVPEDIAAPFAAPSRSCGDHSTSPGGATHDRDYIRHAEVTKRLEESGLDRKQAEAQAEALAEAMQSGVEDLATKHDLEMLRQFAEGRFTLLQWMLGFNLALTIAVLWLLFKIVTASP